MPVNSRRAAPRLPLDGVGLVDGSTLPSGDRGFESISLQRGVRCEPDFLDQGCARALGDMHGGNGTANEYHVIRHRDESQQPARLMRRGETMPTVCSIPEIIKPASITR
jgi:hypothetical protein